MTSYEVRPEPCFDLFKLPTELPGQIQGRDYLIVKTSNQVTASQFSQNSLYDFQLHNPAQMMDLSESFLSMNLALTDLASPANSVAGNNALLGVVASAFSPGLFRQTQLVIGTTVVSSSSTNASITQYIMNLLRWSKSASLGGGDLDLVEWMDVNKKPSTGTYSPSVNFGSQSTDLRPALISSSQVLTAGASPFAVSGTVAGVVTFSSAINPDFNYGFYKRSKFVVYTIGPAGALDASARPTFNMRVPLNRLFGFASPSTPVVYGQPINIRLYPANPSQYIQKTSTTASYDYKINSMELFLNVKRPSASVAAQIQDALASGAKTRLQYTDADTLVFSAQQSNTFTVTLGVPSYYLTWLVLSFRPTSFFADQSNAVATPNVGCSLFPKPLQNLEFPLSQAYITYGQTISPTIPYGTTKADLIRAYTTYQECCGCLDPSGHGALLSYDDWLSNHNVLVFDLRNREITGITGASPSTSLTINLTWSGANAPSQEYQVMATYIAVREVELQASTQGVAVVSV